MKKLAIFNIILAILAMAIALTPRSKIEQAKTAVRGYIENLKEDKKPLAVNSESPIINSGPLTFSENKEAGEYTIEFNDELKYRRDGLNKLVFYPKQNSVGPKTEYSDNLGFFFMKKDNRHSVETNGKEVIINRVFSVKDKDPGSGIAVGSGWQQTKKKEQVFNEEVYQELHFIKTNE